MGLTDGLRRRWDDRVREHTLPKAAYAAIGLADLIDASARRWAGGLRTAYPDLAERGDRRLTQDEAEAQVRQRMADLTDRVAPAVARAQVRSQERARQLRASQERRREHRRDQPPSPP
jgi:hypothetical protein